MHRRNYGAEVYFFYHHQKGNRMYYSAENAFINGSQIGKLGKQFAVRLLATF
jgi:hypothetical protein